MSEWQIVLMAAVFAFVFAITLYCLEQIAKTLIVGLRVRLAGGQWDSKITSYPRAASVPAQEETQP